MRHIDRMKMSEYRKSMRHGPYAWPGGYPTFFICNDGGALCFQCAHDNRREIIYALSDQSGPLDNDWRVVAHEVNWEDQDLHCDHCGSQIEPAYPDFTRD